MRSRLLFLLLAMAVGAPLPGAPAATAPAMVTPRVFPYPYVKHTLPNGLTAILIPMESPGLVAYYSVVRTGSRDEVEEGKSGFAHFFEHMMFRGTKKYPQTAYEAVITRIGAATNAYTTDDLTVYHLNFASEDLEQVIDIESDRFQNLSYSQEVFMTEAGAVYGEYRKNLTNPFALLHEKMSELAYDAHTYKHTTMGFERDIKLMPQQFDYSRSFFERFYRPDNTVLVIAGDFTLDTTIALLRRYYGDWKPGYEAPAVIPEPPQRGERTLEVTYPGRTLPILNIAHKGEAFDPQNRDLLAAVLLGELAFGETSTLRKKLVLQEQKVQVLGASIPLNRDQPLFQIYSMVKQAADLEYVQAEVIRTLEEFKTTPVAAERLDALKRRNKYAFLMALSTPDAVAAGLARFVALTGDIAAVDTFYTTMETITPEDIQRAARKYFVPERRNVVVMKGSQS